MVLWDDFSRALLNCLFPRKLRESKNEEFVNLKKGRMSMIGVRPKISSAISLCTRVSGFYKGYDKDVCFWVISRLNPRVQGYTTDKDMDISWLVAYIQ